MNETLNDERLSHREQNCNTPPLLTQSGNVDKETQQECHQIIAQPAICSSSTCSSSHRFRVKNLGKRKYEILRPFVLLPSLSTSIAASTLHDDNVTNDGNNTGTITEKEVKMVDDKERVVLVTKSASTNNDNNYNSNENGSEHTNSTPSSVTSSTSSASLPTILLSALSNNNKEANNKFTFDRLEYVPSDVTNFWHCPNCIHLPLSKRPKHSVIFHATGDIVCNSSSRSTRSSIEDNMSDDDDNNSVIIVDSDNNSKSSSSSNKQDIIDLTTTNNPPSSDDYQVIAIHSVLCKLKCEEMKMNKDYFGDKEYLSDSCSSSNESSESDDDSDDDSSNSNDDESNNGLRKNRRYRKCRRLNNNQSKRKPGGETKSHIKSKSTSKASATSGSNNKKRGRGRGRPRKKSPSNDNKSTNASTASSRHSDKEKEKHDIIKIEVPSTDNGLIDMDHDAKITATIDCYIMSQVQRCFYEASKDKIAYLRQKALPES